MNISLVDSKGCFFTEILLQQCERVSFSKWMEYNDYHIIHELCDYIPFGLDFIHDYSDYIVHCALELSTMNT